jgi:predicted 2-oxoglutarate/Fe(II)-dependent dioxygenase YbiX
LHRDRGRVTDVVQQGDLTGLIETTVERAYLQHVTAALGEPIAWMETPQVLRYEAGGLYGPHADSDHFNPASGLWHRVLDRDASLLLYLNQDFEGGELSFAQFNYRYKPRRGDLLFFPSHGHYAHQALPVTAGVRYVIVSWAAYRNSPRVQPLPPEARIQL